MGVLRQQDNGFVGFRDMTKAEVSQEKAKSGSFKTRKLETSIGHYVLTVNGLLLICAVLNFQPYTTPEAIAAFHLLTVRSGDFARSFLLPLYKFDKKISA
jgi:hypothetical protein